jgi:phosphatidylserine decarboxylase
MSLLHSLRLVLAKPHRAGWPFIAGAVLVALLGWFASDWLIGDWVMWLALIFAAFCLYFFRDPERVAPPRPGVVVAPADGRVVAVRHALPPIDLGLPGVPMTCVSIFLSVLDVHVNRMPAEGSVLRIAYHEGKFLSANNDKASDENERNSLAVRLTDGRVMAVVQIAGLVARRILCNAKEGQFYAAGERFGIIRFGSRTDLYLPEGVVPLVYPGQTMIGGETVIALLQ